MFGNTNTTDLMLPILLDMANLVRRAIRPGKEIREVKPLRRPYTEDTPVIDTKLQLVRRSLKDTSNLDMKQQLLRRSFDDETLEDDFFDVGVEPAPTPKQELRTRRVMPQKNTITKTNTDKPKAIVENSTKVQDVSNSIFFYLFNSHVVIDLLCCHIFISQVFIVFIFFT